MKTLLVTGGGQGLGEAIAREASARGFRVGLLDVDRNAAEQVAANLAHGVALTADVRDADQVGKAIQQLGAVDVLVNNAGVLRTGPLIDHAPEDFRFGLEVNLFGVFVVAQACARVMRTSGGAIINLASINGIHPSPDCGAYMASKAGVIGLTQQMAIEWGPLGIRVNAVAPGFVDAGMSTPFYQDPTVRERRAGAVPTGRLGTAGDVAKAVLFLASDEAAYVNGHTLTVDGGVINSVLAQLPRE